MDEVGLDDLFEWLLRSNMRCGTDNLIVEQAEEPRRIIFESIDLLPANLQPSDRLSITGLHSVASTSHQLRQYLLQILRSGAQLWDESEDRIISEAEGCMPMNF